MPDDPLDRIAASYKTIADTQQVLAQTQLRMEETHLRMEETQRYVADTQRLGLRLQAFAIGLLGLALLGTAVLVWYGITGHATSEAVLHNTQTIAAQTQALLERLLKP